MKWDSIASSLASDICDECGSRVQNMMEHKALSHPLYRQDSLEKTSLRVKLAGAADPEQQGLEKYRDTGESGQTYEKEMKNAEREKES